MRLLNGLRPGQAYWVAAVATYLMWGALSPPTNHSTGGHSFMPLPWVGLLPRQVSQDVRSDHHGCAVNLLFPPLLQFLLQGFPKEDLPTREACVKGKEHSCRRRHLQVRAVFWGQHPFLYCRLLLSPTIRLFRPGHLTRLTCRRPTLSKLQ